MTLEISLLGSVQISRAGQPIQVKLPHKAIALLAYVALEAHAPQQRDTLAGLFWPEQSNVAARLSLRQVIYKVRHNLPADIFLITPQTVQLNPTADYRFDLLTFIDHLSACRNHVHTERQTCPTCLAHLREGVVLYRGDFLAQTFLADCAAFEEWALLKREWLRHQALQALSDLARGHQAQADFETAYTYAWRQLELDPLREAAHRQLMRSLAGQGRRSEALAQYQKCRDLLATELGVEPAVETTALLEQLKQGVVVSACTTENPLPRHNLPAELTPLIGREKELTGLAQLVDRPDIRLVTILGPGGIGKTKLALAVAQAHIPHFSEGVYFVPLAGLDAGEAIPTTIAQALSFTFYEGDAPLNQLAAYLRQKQVLMVLDNFEHLRDGTDNIITLLRAAPDLKVLATSRIRLAVQGEHLFPLNGLELPAGITTQPSGSVQLFLQAARQVRPSFKLTGANRADVAQICRLVQGMPLGILLAAAWVEILSPAEIVAQLGDEDDSHALDFLATDWQDVTERQRSLRAVCDHSWRLLGDEEQAAFQQLSVFRGGFTAEAAARVSRASLRMLLTLVNKSLLHRVQQGRFEMHELLRQYAQEKLVAAGKADPIRDAHCQYFCDFLHQRETGLKGPHQQDTLVEIEAEGKNIRAAWQRAVAQKRVENLAQALESLRLFLLWRGRAEEGAGLCRQALEQLSQPEPDESPASPRESGSAAHSRLQVRLLIAFSIFLRYLGRLEEAGQGLQQAEDLLESAPLERLDTRLEQAQLRLEQAEVILNTNVITARELAEQSLVICQTLDERWHQAQAIDSLGHAATLAGQLDHAWQVHQDGLHLWQTLGDARGIAQSLRILGMAAYHQGRFDEAAALLDRTLTLCRQIDDRGQLSLTLHRLGNSLIFGGQYAESLPVLKESRAIYDDLGIPSQGAGFLMLGIALVHLGNYDEASVYLQTALRRCRETNNQRSAGFVPLNFGRIALAEGRDKAAQSFVQESITIFQRIKAMLGLSQALGTMGYVALRLNDPLAQNYFRESLQIAVETKLFLPHLTALTGIALWLAVQGDVERAVDLYALALQHRRVANSRWYEDVAGRYIAAAAESLPPETIEAARARGRARDLQETARELLVELKDRNSFTTSGPGWR